MCIYQSAIYFPLGGFSLTSYLRYVICGEANSPVFVSHASFPSEPLRKRLLEIVCYICWVFNDCPVAVIEYCCQDIVGKGQGSAGYDFKVHSLCSPKTRRRNQRLKVRIRTVQMKGKSTTENVAVSLFTVGVYGFPFFPKVQVFSVLTLTNMKTQQALFFFLFSAGY